MGIDAISGNVILGILHFIELEPYNNNVIILFQSYKWEEIYLYFYVA